jgi:hypothetical protein
LTTFTLTETVGVLGSVDAADGALAEVEVLFEAVDVCCANKVPPKQSANRSEVAARKIVLEGKTVLDMKTMVNTMPELWHV